METQHDILVQNKRDIQFKISINRKITVIRGDSATGKTTLFQMVSDAGLEYYQYFFGDKVTTSHGNSNLSKYGSQNSLLIGDGSAIGAYIQDMELTGADMYLPESFEWKLLNNGMFKNNEKVQELIEHPERAVDTKCISMEKYCTSLLNNITVNTPAQYSKSKLNQCYVRQCCCKGTKCEYYTRDKVLE